MIRDQQKYSHPSSSDQPLLTSVAWRGVLAGCHVYTGSHAKLNIKRWVSHLLLLMALLTVTACGRNRAEETPTVTPTPVATLQPTFTATTSRSAASGVGTTSTPAATASISVQRSVAPTATPRPTLTPQVDEQLALAQYQYRIGDYAAARTSLTALLRRPGLSDEMIASAQLTLARTYLAENAFAEANTALTPLLVAARADTPPATNEAQPIAAAAVTTTRTLSGTAPLSDNLMTTDTGVGGTTAIPERTVIALESTQIAALLHTSANLNAKADFLQAVALTNLGEQSQAIAAYWRFLEAYPTMAEFIQPRIATAYLALGDRTSAAAAYARAAEAATEPSATAYLLEAQADLYSSGGQYQDAVRTYDQILGFAANAGYRAEIYLRAGQALAAAGDLPRATTYWRNATEEAPESGSAYLALVELVNREIAFDLFQRGVIDLYAGALQPAINAFQAYIDSVSATDSRVGEAWAGMGRAYLQAESYAAALDAVEQVIANYPTCRCIGQAWLDKAAALAAQGESIGAKRTYRAFARDYPDDELAPEALWRSALLALNEDNRVEAAADLLRLVDAFPTSERAPFALSLVGFGAYREGLHDQAILLYERLQEEYPDYNEDGVHFWLGRAHQASGDTKAAQDEWRALVGKIPESYYGILAAQALQGLPLVSGNALNAMSTVAGPESTLAGDDGSQPFAEQWLATWLNVEHDVIASIPFSVATDSELQIGALLLEVDARSDGLRALGRVYERHKEDAHALYALSLIFEEIGAYRLSIIAMSRLLTLSPAELTQDMPIFLQQRIYPRPFAELIRAEALSHQLNPLLYFSLIRQESLFEEGAQSSAVAQGLAQIIPDTGVWVAERLGHPEYTNEIIFRPHINLKFGAYYLDWARDYLDGNIISALVGYNAGPGNAQAWREFAGADDALFVELLTVNEPRIYVRAITMNLYHYTRLYGSER